MTTPDILAAVAADPNVDPAFARALRPRPLFDADEPDYSGDEPIADPGYADRAAADFEAWRCGR